jgi:hypothetical protein
MKKKVRIKSLPKAQFAGKPPIVLTPQQQDIWKANQNMFGFYGDVTKGSTNTTPSSTQGMVPFSTENPVMTKPFDSASVFGAPNFSMSRVAPSVTPLVNDVDMFNEPYGPLTSSNYYANVAEQYTASPEGTVFTEDAAYAPGYAPVSNSDKSLGDLSKLTQIAGMVPLIQTGIFANMGKKREQNRAEDQFRNRFLSDSLYASIPEGYSGNRGDYTLNYGTGLNFRPDEAVYGQFGKIAQYGGQMKRKIKITGLPKEAYGGTQNTQAVDEMYPYNSNVRRSNYSNMLGGENESSVRQYAEEVPREIANIEAEAGETIVKPSDNGILNMYKIGGKRHSEGGTPLQAGGGDFIFSDTKDMKIKDPAILESFGMSYKKGGYTPAKISKKFNLNNPDIQKTLNDPTADIIARSTAKRMYDNNLSQLGKLALVQEARKGFPQGPPSISMPYMQKVGMDPSMFMPDVMTPQDAQVSMGKAQNGQTFEYSTYDPELVKILNTLDPSLNVPQEGFEKLQTTTKQGTFGRFNPEQASQNWSWYGPINWSDPSQVGKAMRMYNSEMFNRFINAGYSPQEAKGFLNKIGFDPTKTSGVPNALDKKAGKFFETRVLFDVPKKKVDVPPAKQDEVGSYTQDPLVAANVARPSAGVYPQDVMNLGLALGNRLGINKYMPYDVAMPQPMLMDPTFYDPSRELAANAEMANLVTQNLGQFAGPQALSSRASQIQGSGLKGAADILGRYNNLNVGVANQFEQSNKALINDFNMKNALAKSNYYDKTVIANQQYDNSKRTANAEINQQAVNALENKRVTDLINMFSSNYAVDPTTGGTIKFIEGTTPSGQKASTPSSVNALAQLRAQFEQDPDFKTLSPKDKFDVLSKFIPKESAVTRKSDLDSVLMNALIGRGRR